MGKDMTDATWNRLCRDMGKQEGPDHRPGIVLTRFFARELAANDGCDLEAMASELMGGGDFANITEQREALQKHFWGGGIQSRWEGSLNENGAGPSGMRWLVGSDDDDWDWQRDRQSMWYRIAARSTQVTGERYTVKLGHGEGRYLRCLAQEAWGLATDYSSRGNDPRHAQAWSAVVQVAERVTASLSVYHRGTTPSMHWVYRPYTRGAVTGWYPEVLREVC